MDLQDDILSQLKSINNLLERIATSIENLEDMTQKSWQAYVQATKR